ncbi:ABC transporter ATP-binding protein [Candidatus Kirkpatrickella diaphorinae]|uniref:ABC transporter ATP-binding protein n=1 Tax=Candidatus Kirkpatrickella diaphorinae TaxID=2984322 RepID=A0ABY6GKV3_9PROT|nr:ABC transporter ATP-binding protein [Candidatus Kirkpatrickella diaphorinae]UYH51443.1 ABC transporter ATP-binding protein [Candidatus Kirkpatrickella diaphorinae]
MTTPMIELRDIYRTFPGHRRGSPVQALRGVNLLLQRGETLAIIGESGCGKTTLGHIMALMSAPDRGQILFDGVDVTSPRRGQRNALRRKVQMVLQDSGAAFNPFWRVGSALRAPLKIIRHANPAHRVQEVLEAVGLPSNVMQQFPQELSGGQRQRLNIARALTIAPELLIADEPTSALDVSVQARIIQLLADLNTKHHLSMVVITHNLATIPYMTRNVAIMYLGRIVEWGASDDVLYAPHHPYTRLLVDSLPGRRGGRAALTMGDVPSAVHPPPGCAFHPRCHRAQSICREIMPELSESTQSPRRVACHFPLDG